jgi:hypothetical protein
MQPNKAGGLGVKFSGMDRVEIEFKFYYALFGSLKLNSILIIVI